MSWLFSQALVAAYSADCLPDGAPSAQLNVMPGARPFLRGGKMTAFLRPSQFGLTCAALTEGRGADVLTWFRVDFLARTSASRARARASRVNDQGCGANFSGLFARFDPALHMWKTAQHSLLGDSHECLQILPRSGLMRSGCLYPLPPVAHGMNAPGCGLLPTLTVHGNNNRKGLTEKSGDGLATALRLLPTLTKSFNNRVAIPGTKRRDGLQTAISKMPALTVQDAKNNGGASQQIRNTAPLNSVIGGPLNPEWCEWFMGWPIGWTGLQPLATDKFQSWLRAHGRG